MLVANMGLFVRVIKLASSINAVKFAWEPKSQRLKMLDTPTQKKVSNICHLYKILTIFVVLQASFGYTTIMNGSSSTKIVIAITIPGLLLLNTFVDTCTSTASEFVLCINGFLQFDALYCRARLKHLNRIKSFMESLNLLFAKLVYISAILIPFLMLDGIYWRNPCKPSLIGYWALEQCVGQGEPSKFPSWQWILSSFLKLSVFLLNHYYWIVGFAIAPVIISGEMILCTLALSEYLDTFFFRAKYRISTVFHNAKVYRFIQLLNLFLNRILQRVLISFIAEAILLTALSLVAMVRLDWKSYNMVSLVLAGLLLANSLSFFNISLGGMVGVYTKSAKVLQAANRIARVGRGHSQAERKWLMKFYRSCPLLKMRIGYCNFLDGVTPLVCIDVAINLTVQLLLITG
ncbi:unnamed protein product [Orchesella dallaii]|uniref:Gustatory receptor n=1 Tax=Orchesella dallaii TaxID=48710 RepID=A0ABP1QRB7_9HEXA